MQMKGEENASWDNNRKIKEGKVKSEVRKGRKGNRDVEKKANEKEEAGADVIYFREEKSESAVEKAGGMGDI